MSGRLETLHRVSEALSDRWPVVPYEYEDGSRAVSIAHGRRATQKLSELLAGTRAQLSNDELAAALDLQLQLVALPERLLPAVEDDSVAVAATILVTSPEARLRSRAARLLTCLITLEQGRVHLSRVAGVAKLADVVSADGDDAVRDAAADTLTTLCRYRDGRTAVLSSQPALSTIVCALPRTPRVMHACRELASDARSVAPLLAADVMPAIARAIAPPALHRDGGEEGANSVAYGALCTLRSLLHDDAGKTLALATHTVPSLVHVSMYGHARAQVVSSGCLATLSVPGDGKRAILACEPFLPTMHALLHHSEMAVVDNARITCRNVVEIPEGRRAVTRSLMAEPSVFVAVFGCRSETAQEVVHALADGSVEQAAAAIATLNELVCAPGAPSTNAGTIRGCLHTTAYLTELCEGRAPSSARWRGTPVPSVVSVTAAGLLTVL